jgi:hypothetical protein
MAGRRDREKFGQTFDKAQNSRLDEVDVPGHSRHICTVVYGTCGASNGAARKIGQIKSKSVNRLIGVVPFYSHVC